MPRPLGPLGGAGGGGGGGGLSVAGAGLTESPAGTVNFAAGDTTLVVGANSVVVNPAVVALRSYVDAAIQGLDVKPSVRAASTGNLNLASMPAAVDGVTLASGVDSFLAKDQSTASQNGLYLFNGTGAAATRRADADADAEVTTGLFVFVAEGTANGNTGWVLTTDDPIVVGTTALAFAQFSGAGTYTSGSGLTLTGAVFAADFGTGAGKVTQGNDARLSDTRTPTDGSVTNAKLAAGAVATGNGATGDGTSGSPIKHALASQAAGDSGYFNGTDWVRLPIVRGGFYHGNDGATPSFVALSLMPRVDVATTTTLAAYTASGATLTADANGAFANQDGVTAAAGQVYLVRSTHVTSGIHTGVYTLTTLGNGSTPWVLTRHNRLYTGAAASGTFAVVRQGTQAGYVYQCQTTPGSDVVGTDALTFTLISAPNALGVAGGRSTITGGVAWATVTTTTASGGVTTTAGTRLIRLTGYSGNGFVTLDSSAAVAGQRVEVQDRDHKVTQYEFKVVASSGFIGISGQTAWHLLKDGGAWVFEFDGTNWDVVRSSGQDVVQDVALMPSVASGLLLEYSADFGTTIATGVSSWATRTAASGFDKPAENATGSQQPTVNATWSRGQPALLFTAASSQRLVSATWTGAAVTQPYTWYVVSDFTDSVNNTARFMLDGIGASNRAALFVDNTASSINAYAGSSVGGAVAGSSAEGKKRVTVGVFNNSATALGRIYANEQLLFQVSPGAQVPQGIVIGAGQAISGFWNGHQARIFLFQGGHSDAQVADVVRRLRAWYAI